MKGILFNEIHSYRDLNLILSEVDIPPASPKTNYVEIEGGDGALDLTEALGDVFFENRDCSFTFSVLPQDDFEAKKTEVSNLLNGQVKNITLDKDSAYYYYGRCSVNRYKSEKMLRQIVIDARVQPYKYKQGETVESFDLSANEITVDLVNGRMSTVPTVTLANTQNVTDNGTTVQMHTGNSTANILDFRLYGKSVQNGTPTPTTPIDIEHINSGNGFAVTICGKNLFDAESCKIYNNGGEYPQLGNAVVENNIIKLTKNSESSYFFGHYVNVEIGKPYTISFKGGKNNNGDAHAIYVYSDKPYGNTLLSFSTTTETARTFNPQTSRIFIGLYVCGSTTTTEELIYTDVLLEKGTVKTAYELYSNKKIPILLTKDWCGIPVSSGGNYTDVNGQQWICDEIDLKRGKYIKRISTKVLEVIYTYKHIEEWANKTAFVVSNLFADAIPVDGYFTKANIMSPHFDISTPNDISNTAVNKIAVGGNFNLYLSVDGITDEASLKNWISANNPIIYYPLATPQESDLPTETLEAIRSLVTYKSQTNISNNVNAEMLVDYVINTVIDFNGDTFAVSEGTHKVMGLQLKEGSNFLKLTGNGNITIAYQEGDL